MRKNAAQPPICLPKPHELEMHGDVRIDNYYWLNNRENQEVINYLNEENAYTEAVMADTKGLQENLYNEMVGRIKQQDESVPYFLNGYWYYTRFEEGKEYPIYCRKKDNMDSEELTLLDVNILAEGHAYYQVGGLSISPDNKILAFGVDKLSRRIYTIYFKTLENGKILAQTIENTTGGGTWAADNKTLFYTTKDAQTLRSDKIHRYNLETDESEMIYHEKDETFYAGVSKSKSREYIIISCGSTLTSEYQYLKSENPYGDFKIFHPRERKLEYGISHFKDKWYVLTNWNAQNFRLMECGLENTEKEFWNEVIPHRKETLLEGIELFDDYMVLEERTKGLTHIRVRQMSTGSEHYIAMDEETYTCGASTNPEYKTDILRFGYTSLTTPSSTYDYNMNNRERKLLKQQEVVGGYDKSQYQSERLYASVRDGVEVPISIVYKKGFEKNAKSPLLLYAYGSYGHSIDPYFSSSRLSLLDRGFAFAIAHIRGGEEMGRNWYETGKLLEKKNTFFDFIDCAKHLISNNYSSPEHLYAMGGSAGGLLMGAIINMEPELWNGVIAAVPFVDVVTTMLDESIPLTTGEFDEWGNPKEEDYYWYIKSYSPYDNVEAKKYPNMLVTTGLHDSQVQYWEPAKWVAKLREMKADDNILLLKTEMDFGHGGASGRFEQFKEVALEYAFLLSLEGIDDLA
ncbi:MAG: S9 family peptidase [Flavobacteriales bacterium]|nr:S9 family peptidase [Flavobacteriales bacterium]